MTLRIRETDAAAPDAVMLMRALDEDRVSLVPLETGDGQPEGIGLYDRCGYLRIPCFGEYDGSRHSHCFEERLPPRHRVP